MSDAVSDLQRRFGLELDPFAPDALPDFFFVGGQRRFLAQRTVHALYFAGGTALLTGPRGAGKSRLLQEVLADLRDLADTCRIDATVMMDGGEIRRTVVSMLGLPPASALDNTSLVAALVHWQPVGREPHPVVLIVDDAHLLAVPALAECLSLVRGSGGRLRLLLAGEPDLVAASEQAGAGAVERIDLPALDRQETADYIATRLQAAGYRGEAPLSAVELRELHERSAGNFGAIHAALPALFEIPPPPSGGLLDRLPGAARLRVLRELPRQHVAIGAGLLLVVILMVMNRNGGEDTAPPVEESAGGRQSVALTLPGSVPATTTSDSAAPASTGEATRSSRSAPAPVEPAQSVAAPAPLPAPKSQPTPAPEPARPAAQPQTKPAPVQPAARTAPQPERPPVAPAPAKPPAPTIVSGQKIPLPPPVRSEAAPAATAPSTAQSANSSPAAAPPTAAPAGGTIASVATLGVATSGVATPDVATPGVATPGSATPSPTASQAAAPAPEAAGGGVSADERELLAWSSKQFALQLLGAGSSGTVTKFIQQAGGTRLYTYRTDLNGRPWYIVVTGPYPSRNAATAAADALPANLRNQKPWPRAVKNIHADIRQRK